MKTKKVRFFIWVICASFVCVQSLFAMDVKAEFKKADEYYMRGTEPRQALELYRKIIADGGNSHFVKLSLFKTGIILDEQMLQYDKAMKVYQDFLNKYPDGRLSKIVRRNLEYLQSMEEKGVLNDYKEFQELEGGYLHLMQGDDVTRKQRKQAAKALYHYAMSNYTNPFSKEVMKSALHAVTNERLFLLSNRIIGLIDEKLPEIREIYDTYWTVVKMQCFRIRVVRASWIYAALCLMVILIKGGYKSLWADIRKNKWVYLFLVAGVFSYITAGYVYFMNRDPNVSFEWKPLFLMLGQLFVLLPVAISFYHSFSLESGMVKSIGIWCLSILLGIANWMIFAYYFDYMWLFNF